MEQKADYKTTEDVKPVILCEFDFALVRVQSMADGAPRVVLDLPEYATDAAVTMWQERLKNKRMKAFIVVIEETEIGEQVDRQVPETRPEDKFEF